MGIKFFFSWLKSEFPQHLKNFKTNFPPADVVVDTFMIDLNGVFHNSAAKIYKYGNYESKQLLQRVAADPSHLQRQCFEDICKTIDNLVQVVKPNKTLVLCIDGVAPVGKQNQQRQRRFRGIVEDVGKKISFDSRCITPGTEWMHCLSMYIDWYIRKKMTDDTSWQRLRVYFSNEKVPGEGEHKLIDWIRNYGTDKETYCINALDADLVMLSLGTGKINFYLLREELYDKNFNYTYVDVGRGLRKDIANNLLFWKGSDEDQIIYDFILVVFLCGNDFLPNIPSISLIDKGLSTIIDIYKQSCSTAGHLVDKQGEICSSALTNFFHLLGKSEKSLLEDKWSHRTEYISDPLLESHTTVDANGVAQLDFEGYKHCFYQKKEIPNPDAASHLYIDGCAWVLQYYLFGVKDWSFMYPFNYAPFATDIGAAMSTYCKRGDKSSPPISSFLQLLCVLPRQSSSLLPKPLDKIFTMKSVSDFFPEQFQINYEGKKKKWEGVVELPPVNVSILKKEMELLLDHVSPDDLRRNVIDKSHLYINRFQEKKLFQSMYGNFFTSVVVCECPSISKN